MQAELAEAIRLRESGENEKSRDLLLKLVDDYPEDPFVNYQCAWIHDRMGMEREAVPFYEKAIASSLPDDELKGAMLGLGSTYRSLGRYADAVVLLSEATDRFPENREFAVFLAMALYNQGAHREGLGLALKTVAETTSDPGIASYREAILFYADNLDEIWD